MSGKYPTLQGITVHTCFCVRYQWYAFCNNMQLWLLTLKFNNVLDTNMHSRRKFDGLCMSASQGKDANKRTIYYLQFGVPPPGINAGNTAANTHAVLQIIGGAMNDTYNHGDGGWIKALLVCYERVTRILPTIINILLISTIHTIMHVVPPSRMTPPDKIIVIQIFAE